MITFGYTILYVENVENTIHFYQNAFGFEQKFMTPEKDYAELDTGNTTLAFASYEIAAYNGIEIAQKNTFPPPFEITLITDAMETDYEQALKAGALPVQPPLQKPWGQTVAYVKDINGFLVELCTSVSG